MQVSVMSDGGIMSVVRTIFLSPYLMLAGLFIWHPLQAKPIRYQMGTQGQSQKSGVSVPNTILVSDGPQQILGTPPIQLKVVPGATKPKDPKKIISIYKLVPSLKGGSKTLTTTGGLPLVKGSLDSVFGNAPLTNPAAPTNPPTAGVYDHLSFGAAFDQAYTDLGRAKIFVWRGRRYATCRQGVDSQACFVEANSSGN